MSSVASKNLYDLLGNTSDDDPDRIPPVPTEVADKPTQRSGKRNAAAEPAPKDPAGGPRGGRGGRGRGGRGGATGSEQAFLDKEAGRSNNRDKPVDDGVREDRHRDRLGTQGRGRGRRDGEGRGVRGGRGARWSSNRDDRLSRTVHSGPNDQAKQAAHGWGENTGEGEWNDEKAGEEIAVEEEKQGFDTWERAPIDDEGEKPTGDENLAPAAEVPDEPEDKTKSYADYLEEQKQKRLELGGTLTARKANEGAEKLPSGKEIERANEDTYYIGSGGKKGRERERKEKNVLALDHDIQARERDAPRGGRGGGGRGRGRGEGGFRGEGRGRGGGRGRGEGRGEFRGRGGRGGPSPNVSDTSAFPSLGGA